ncbi:MAG TPA: D-glycero-beta-D-manno-heptose-7-phosphate kinase, partial [Myxococcota bacterium]|nr:D-glycero-beta-D-manno-heptose-7-phosphate kinase [Myxococcota bacterium]
MRHTTLSSIPHHLPLLVAGDLMLDEYLRGAVSRISPEAPVPVLESAASEQALGGAANVASNLAALGAQVIGVGAVGDDAAGAALLGLLAQRGVAVGDIQVLARRPTTHKLRVVAQVQHVLRIDREVRAPLPEDAAARALAAVEAHLPAVRGVLCSDYQKGFLTPTLVQGIIRAARRAGVPVLVDPKGLDYRCYAGATVLTPNAHELHLATGAPVDTPEGLQAAALAVLTRTEAEAVLVTCGKDGMVLFERGGAVTRIPAEAREVYDVTGAGDTVIATLALAHCAGASLQAAARLANTAAGVVVGKLGTATVSRDELQHACDATGGTGEGKVVSLQALLAELLRLRGRGRR